MTAERIILTKERFPGIINGEEETSECIVDKRKILPDNRTALHTFAEQFCL